MSYGRTNLLSVVCLAAFVLPASAADTKPDPREKLDTAIVEGIKLLEAKDYTTFLRMFVAPDDYKKLTEKQTVEEFAKVFANEKAATVLKILKAIKDTKPKESTESSATYEHGVEGVGKKTITFAKVDKYWYIRN